MALGAVVSLTILGYGLPAAMAATPESAAITPAMLESLRASYKSDASARRAQRFGRHFD